jgi:hypothetical protein
MTKDLYAAAPSVVLLVDETAAMQEAIRDGKKSRSAAVATAINSLLKQLAAGTPCCVALLGYKLQSEAKVAIGSRWSGELSNQFLVTTETYRNVPVVVEQRTRRIPDASGFGIEREETIEFPVWYQPQARDRESTAAALKPAMLTDSRTLVVHITSGGETAQHAAEAIRECVSQAASYAHVEVGSSSGAPAICFPANLDFLPQQEAAIWFERANLLSHAALAELRARGLQVNVGARALILQGGLKELLDAFSAARAWVTDSVSVGEATAEPAAVVVEPTSVVAPPAMHQAKPPSVEDKPLTLANHIEEAEESAHQLERPPQKFTTVESEPAVPVRRGLMMIVLDRSLEDPVAPPTNDVFTRIKQQTNDILAEIARTADGWLDVGLVTYGRHSSGTVEVSTRFFGGLSDHSIVTDRQLVAGVIRTEMYEQQVPNGIGGIITLQRKRPMYLELPPTEQASSVEAFQAVAPLLGGWCSRNRGECAAPLIIHMTRGALSQRDLRAGLKKLKSVRSTAGPPLVHHVVLTESPGPAAAYPVDCNAICPADLRFFCQLSSPHVAAKPLAEKHRQIQPDSRGIVVNGNLDLVVAGFRLSLCKSAV